MPEALNKQASTDARHSRGGKDGVIYDGDGNLMARVSSFSSKANFANAKYSVLGNPQDMETPGSYSLTITMEETVIESEKMLEDIINYMNGDECPVWTFQGTIKGRNGSEERISYPEVIPSGDIDIQNITVGDTLKRAWNCFCNGKPKLVSTLTID